MLNLTGCLTVSGGKYNLDRLDPVTCGNEFLRRVLRSRQVMYHWGGHQLFACDTRFVVDYEQKMIFEEGTGVRLDTDVTNNRWIYCDPDDVPDELEQTFEGSWGPTAADTILRWERSGVRVDICGTKGSGLEDPQGFLQQIREIATR